MKKTTSVLIAAALLACAAGCSSSAPAATSAETTTSAVSTSTAATAASTVPEAATAETTVNTEKAPENAAPLTLANKMSEFERACVTKRGLTLTGKWNELPDVKLENVVVTAEAMESLHRRMVERGWETEEEYKQIMDEAKGYTYPEAIINGVIYNGFIPPKGYDGGKLEYGEGRVFDNKDEYFTWLFDDLYEQYGYTMSDKEMQLKATKVLFDAVINGNYKELPDRYEMFEAADLQTDPLADFRFAWEFDRASLEGIKDRIEEYSVYDDTLCTEFIVHVTLPPDYDSARTYPVFFLTDGVWRLNDHAALYKTMEDGEAADTILVSLGLNYNIKNEDNYVRLRMLIDKRGQLLDFITDDLMPLLGENYNIDYANSTLFGHSMGGVFSHYALFNSDRYENQPFGRYIIGSPAFFNLYDSYMDLDPAGAETDYGYFDRHDKLDKKVFLCGGSEEDIDYSDYYNGHDSTLEGLKKLNDRISAHSGSLTYKLYDSHHYQYVPEMLIEYLKAEYPR